MKELAMEEKPCNLRNFVNIDEIMSNELLQKGGWNSSAAIKPELRPEMFYDTWQQQIAKNRLMYSSLAAHNTIYKIVPQTCEVIVQEYLEEVLCFFRTPE